MEVSVSLDRILATGVFDEALGTFSSSESTFSGMTVNETVTEPSTIVTYHFADGHAASSATPGLAGGVDYVSSYEINQVSEIFSVGNRLERNGRVSLSVAGRKLFGRQI